MSAGVYLINPKFPHNVGGALRASACFGVDVFRWDGTRVPPVDQWPKGSRLPREERLRINQTVDWGHGIDQAVRRVGVPVCVERLDNAESLVDFVHPEDALYIFGPEDGTIGKGVRAFCHRFVCIPTTNDGPLNLAAAVNVVLYDRFSKLRKEIP